MRKYVIRCVLGVTILAAGCGGGGGPVPVRGRVLLDDLPVEGATVMLMPMEGGHPAAGLTDASGEFRLKTFERDDGALPGRYKILVTKTGSLPPPPEGKYGDAARILNNNKGLKTTGKKPELENKNKHELPSVYGDAARTPLRVTVPTEGEAVLRLESKAR